jgi:A/G-specific adenine glycosylase
LDKAFIYPLLKWYRAHADALPWRENQDPYRVWFSEIMLQQTQVTTVIPYYERFLAAYPTVFDLAAAERDSVLKMWEGLGYYSRARNLHRAAKIVAEEYGGEFPNTAEALQELPGIGRYTAGAIASIAFDESAPVLDGNVIRVFARLFDISEDVSQTKTKNDLWNIAEVLVPAKNPGDYNQALMELGRTVCKPRNPLCEECPIRDYCRAYAENLQNERPVKKKRAPTPHYDVTAGLIRNGDGQLLIAKRLDDALLGGLWEFPGGKQEDGESLPECLARELQEELAIVVEVGAFFVKVKHAYTHFKITLHVFECTFLPEGGQPQAIECADWRWIAEDELEQYAFSAADRQVIAALNARNGMLF